MIILGVTDTLGAITCFKVLPSCPETSTKVLSVAVCLAAVCLAVQVKRPRLEDRVVQLSGVHSHITVSS